MIEEGHTHPVIERLANALIERAASCRRILDAA